MDADNRVAPQVAHQVAAHERGGDRFHRQPRCFDGAGGQHHGARGRDVERFLLSVDPDFLAG